MNLVGVEYGKALKWSVLCLVTLSVFVLSLFYHFFPVLGSSIRVITIAVFALLLIILFELEQFKQINRGILFYLIFSAYAMLSLTYAYDMSLSLNEFWPIVGAGSVLICTYTLSSSIEKYLKASGYLVLILSCYSVFLLLYCFYKNTDLFMLKKSYNLIGAEIFLGIVLTMIAHHLTKKSVFLLAAILFSLIIVASGSIKTITALFLFFLFIAYHEGIAMGRLKLKSLFKVLVGGSLVIVPVFHFLVDSAFLWRRVKTRLSFLSESTKRVDASAQLRVRLYARFLEVWDEHFFWGAGLNNFRHLFFTKYGTYTYSHNTFIELLVGLGIWGTFFYCVFFFYPMYLTLRRYRETRSELFLLLFGGFVGFLIMNMGQRMYANIPMVGFIGLSLALTGPCYRKMIKVKINGRHNTILRY